MPKWLTKAKAAFKTPEPLPPEPFRLVCVCGGIINGVRQEREQRIRCGDCNHEMFVLPESVYPPPEIRSRGVIEETDETEDEVEIVEEPSASSDDLPPGPADAITIAPEKLGGKPSKTGKRKRRKNEDPSDPEKRQSPERADRPQAVEVDHVHGIRDLRQRRFKIITPFRAIAAGILVVLLLTGYSVLHSRSVANAEVVRTQAGKLGQQALDAGDLATAYQEFIKVDKALQILGSGDPQSQQLHQLFLEVRAAVELLPTSVLDMVASAVDASSETAITSWENQFDLTYRDKWLVVDTTVRHDDSIAKVRIPVPLLLEDNSAFFVVDGESFAERITGEGEQHVIFAGRVISCQSSGTKHKTWEIRLADDSLLFWTDPRTYELLGFALDEESTKTLRQQADMLGVAK
ncbi:hypothetical protein CA54_30610 [Symmachiella macrocystis]|uniref:Uncharacterized protein n=1 Tax=Symmachiella macrocystis TaxID=2527985 RepID=A0A5C6BQ79_9PLAN|nr:hypothetical protein [Symmachiella macrocystis]TWU14218.1 hypothetical protein CA54_30610 [Symmachiella macrocystis]